MKLIIKNFLLQNHFFSKKYVKVSNCGLENEAMSHLRTEEVCKYINTGGLIKTVLSLTLVFHFLTGVASPAFRTATAKAIQ